MRCVKPRMYTTTRSICQYNPMITFNLTMIPPRNMGLLTENSYEPIESKS